MTWWTRLFRRGQMEEQLEKELSFHLDQHAGDLAARGLDPSEARREAKLALGGPEQVKEKCRDARGTRWLEDFAQDARHALRTFRRKPGFAAVTVLILALGIGAATVMFALVNSVLLRPLAFPEPERLVSIHGFTESFGEYWGFSPPDFADVRRQSKTLAAAAWTYGGGTISAPGAPEYVDGRQISSELFSTLGVTPLQGRAFRPNEDHPGGAPAAIISYSLWQRRFGGDSSIVGRNFVFEGKPYAIVGVAPAGVQLDGPADVFTPLFQQTEPRMQNRAAHFLHVVARLRSGATYADAQSEVGLIGHRLEAAYPESNRGAGMRVRGLQEEIVGNVRGTLWLLLAAVGLVLAIACVNIASLMLTRAISREREFAMRVALGAGRSRLARACLTESLVLGVFGGLLGVFIAKVSVPPFVTFWPGNLPRAEEIHLDWRVLTFGVGLSLLSAFFCGLAPILRIPFRSLDPSLRAGGRTIASGSRRLYGAFVVSEIALAFVLLVCAGMLGNTLLTLSSLDPGFNPRNVLAARFAISPAALRSPEQIRAAWRDVLARIRRVPEVEYAALADIIPMREGENSLPYRTSPAPPPPNQEPIALASSVTPDYLKVMGIPLRAGRFLDERDNESSDPVIVIDENLARHAFGTQNAVGRQLWVPAFGAAPVQIVGVVGHVRHWGLAGDDQSRVRDQMYYPFAQVPAPLLRFFSSVMSIAMRTKTPPLGLVEPLRLQLRGAGGDQALYEPRSMEQLVSASLARQRFLLILFRTFAALSLLLASTGIYGVLAYLTGQRTSEIGVRIAVGATTRDIVRLVMRQSLWMVFVGLGAGVIGSMAAGRVFQRFLEGMRPAYAPTFAIMIPLLLIAALLASFIPARRASRVDSVSALRQE
jgi:predicted permease